MVRHVPSRQDGGGVRDRGEEGRRGAAPRRMLARGKEWQERLLAVDALHLREGSRPHRELAPLPWTTRTPLWSGARSITSLY